MVLRATTADPAPQRYHAALVILHWLIAILIIAPLALGHFVLAKLPGTDPLLFHGLRAHMGLGLLIGIAMLARLLVRMGTRRPRPAATGSRWLDSLARASHGLLYVAVLGQVTSGLLLAWEARLFTPVLAGHGSLPQDFAAYPALTFHYVCSRVLLVLIMLHISGLLYHWIARGDGLIRRMTLG